MNVHCILAIFFSRFIFLSGLFSHYSCV